MIVCHILTLIFLCIRFCHAFLDIGAFFVTLFMMDGFVSIRDLLFVTPIFTYKFVDYTASDFTRMLYSFV